MHIDKEKVGVEIITQSYAIAGEYLRPGGFPVHGHALGPGGLRSYSRHRRGNALNVFRQ